MAAEDRIAVCGDLPADAHSLCASFLGLYSKRAELINGRPSYVKVDDPAKMIWHASFVKYKNESWCVGDAVNRSTPGASDCVYTACAP